MQVKTATIETGRHINSEGELITINVLQKGPFKGQPMLVIHDNLDTKQEAPTLLDEGMIDWLLKTLTHMKEAQS